MFIVLIYQITFGKLLHWFSLALNEYLSVVPPSVDSLKQLFNIACDIHSWYSHTFSIQESKKQQFVIIDI